jgi:hypothetical protein
VDGVIKGVWGRKGAQVSVRPFEALPADLLDDEIADVRRFLAGEP